jgi:hypothetical protein
MPAESKLILLVGDNAFQGVNHLSQGKARERTDDITNPEYCADLVLTALENGADGFMFSVNKNMLSILKAIKRKNASQVLSMHAILPSAVDYIRASGQKGMEGLAKDFTMQMLTSGNAGAVWACLEGAGRGKIKSLLRGLISLEIGEIKSAAGRNARLDSVLLHELLTDMGLALDLRWLFEEFIKTVKSYDTKVGFQTRNFCLLIKKFKEWNIDLNVVLIVAPFNNAGFQMSPSKVDCENVLTDLPAVNIIAINILASGYLSPPEAVEYIQALPNMVGVAVGISKEKHAHETFKTLAQLKR